jgi:o-succinylbenzoate synthase
VTGRSGPSASAAEGPRIEIVSAAADRLAIPLRRPFSTAVGTWRQRDTWLLRLRDSTGREGFGEACLDPSAGPDDLERLAGFVRAATADLLSSGGIDRWAAAGDDGAPRAAVAAAITSAMVDLGWPWAGRPAAGRSAAGLEAIGSVPVNATIATDDPDGTVVAAAEAVAAGFGTLKLKGGAERSTADLLERLRAVRRVVGPDIELRLDVNGAWDPRVARERLQALADVGLAYVEQPISPGDPADLAALRADSPVAIAADESVTSVLAARDLLRARAVDLLVVKPTRVGGIVRAVAIIEDAAAAGVTVVVSTLLETGVGLAAALRVAVVATTFAGAAGVPRPPAHGLATAGALADDLLLEPLEVAGGRLAVPTGPGLGVSVDRKTVDRWSVERVEAVG